jgi:tRNA nucleotidyltransferase (CCA-adding enzyme)
MDIVVCHTTADFDTLGAAVGFTRLHPGCRIVLAGGAHPAVKDFLALHRDEYPLIERRSVPVDRLQSLTVVDTQWRDRLGKVAEWLDRPNLPITVYDHHEVGGMESDIPATQRIVEFVGATTTLIVEQLRQRNLTLNTVDATVMALGIHVDTGSLTYEQATPRDAAALTWLMEQGASQRVIGDYTEPGLSAELQDLLTLALDQLQVDSSQGWAIASVLLTVDGYIQGLSSVVSHLMSLTDSDVLLFGVRYPVGEGDERVTVIGRSRSVSYGESRSGYGEFGGVDLGALFAPLGGGGHAKAAALTVRGMDADQLMITLREQVKDQVPHPPTARELMSSPVRTIRPETTIGEAQRILLRYGHSGLSVVDEQDQLVGIISRRDLDIALHHDFSHAPVKGFMTTNVKTITPDTTLPDIESLMVTYDIGRLPVVDQGDLIGIVTRTDVLRQLHQEKTIGGDRRLWGQRLEEELITASILEQRSDSLACPLPNEMRSLLERRLTPALWRLLEQIAHQAEQRGWQLYLVGGGVRDILLAGEGALNLSDIDLVVDGFHRSADQAAGVELARSLQRTYPHARLQTHGRFQTAALLWHNDSALDSLWLDIATARTEFYPYPAANPEVEASSIRQDLYRRDFTINALAIRLTRPRQGELLDFFGGLLDLRARQIRVLHANSFIEDPTRIFRAVRFAVRLGFALDPQTEGYIRHAIASGIYHRVQADMEKTPALQTRLRQELKYILEAPYWMQAVQMLSNLGALCCIHNDLQLGEELWKQLRLVHRWMQRFDPQQVLNHWQILLEVMLISLPEGAGAEVATNLKLPADSIERLRSLPQWQQHVIQALPQGDRPSQVVQTLEPYSLATLTLLAVTCPRPIRRLIWHYQTHLMRVQPPLDGNDLKALGYKPGKAFKPMLEQLRNATLDGEVGDRAEAIAFVQAHFPLPETASKLKTVSKKS